MTVIYFGIDDTEGIKKQDNLPKVTHSGAVKSRLIPSIF